MKKVIIDKDKCIGCGACVSIAPDCFDFDDQGLSELVKEDATNEEVIDAIESCPTEAIYIDENTETNNINADEKVGDTIIPFPKETIHIEDDEEKAA